MANILEDLINLGWIAGLLEGEGSFGVAKRKKDGYSCRVAISMTDPDVIQKAKDLSGFGRVYGPYPVKESNVGSGPFKDRYLWVVQGKKAAELMRGVLPFMGARRSDRILEILNGYDDYLKKVKNG